MPTGKESVALTRQDSLDDAASVVSDVDEPFAVGLLLDEAAILTTNGNIAGPTVPRTRRGGVVALGRETKVICILDRPVA